MREEHLARAGQSTSSLQPAQIARQASYAPNEERSNELTTSLNLGSQPVHPSHHHQPLVASAPPGKWPSCGAACGAPSTRAASCVEGGGQAGRQVQAGTTLERGRTQGWPWAKTHVHRACPQQIMSIHPGRMAALFTPQARWTRAQAEPEWLQGSQHKQSPDVRLRLQQLLILLHSSIGSAQRRGRRVGVFHSLQGCGGRGWLWCLSSKAPARCCIAQPCTALHRLQTPLLLHTALAQHLLLLSSLSASLTLILLSMSSMLQSARKASRANSSRRLFCSGVPVMSSRHGAPRSRSMRPRRLSWPGREQRRRARQARAVNRGSDPGGVDGCLGADQSARKCCAAVRCGGQSGRFITRTL